MWRGLLLRLAVSARRHWALPRCFGGARVRATTTAYPMAEADRALDDLAHGRFSGAAVLHNEG